MKKFLQTTILVVLIFTTINASAKSKLTISTTMPTAIKVVIDGQKFYSQDNYLSIKNLQPGYHNISIYYIKNGKDFNNFFSNGNGSYWKKAASRQVVVRNNYQYDVTINRFGRPFYDQDYYYSNNNNNWKTDGNNDGDDNEEEDGYKANDNFDFNSGYNEDYNDLDFFKKKPNTVIDDNKNHSNNGNTNNNDDKNNNYNYNNSSSYKPMSNEMFTQVKQTLQQTSFESSKLSIAKQVLDNNTISISQVKEIMSVLTMEIDKLDFAKYAYDKTRERNNYFTVANGLSMQSDKDELLKYIRDKK